MVSARSVEWWESSFNIRCGWAGLVLCGWCPLSSLVILEHDKMQKSHQVTRGVEAEPCIRGGIGQNSLQQSRGWFC